MLILYSNTALLSIWLWFEHVGQKKYMLRVEQQINSIRQYEKSTQQDMMNCFLFQLSCLRFYTASGHFYLSRVLQNSDQHSFKYLSEQNIYLIIK